MAGSGRLVGFAHIQFARFNGAAVVAHAERTADYVHLVATFGVKPVGVGRGVGVLYL